MMLFNKEKSMFFFEVCGLDEKLTEMQNLVQCVALLWTKNFKVTHIES